LLVAAGHLWVLHKGVIIRGAVALAVVVGLVGLYQGRDAVAAGTAAVGSVLQGRFADAGFGIAEISMSGQRLTSEAEILAALAVEERTSTLSFDVEAARERVAALPAVESVSIRKSYPGLLKVDLVEKTPVARWRVDGVTFLIDGQGIQIANAKGGYSELPLLIGDGAADDALAMIMALDRHPELKSKLLALSRIADRRWDLIYDTGLRVQLPESGVAQALDNLVRYQRDYQIMDRDLALIDLRVHGMLAVRLVERPDAEDGAGRS
jgi:cell division protein FtsQ